MGYGGSGAEMLLAIVWAAAAVTILGRKVLVTAAVLLVVEVLLTMKVFVVRTRVVEVVLVMR